MDRPTADLFHELHNAFLTHDNEAFTIFLRQNLSTLITSLNGYRAKDFEPCIPVFHYAPLNLDMSIVHVYICTLVLLIYSLIIKLFKHVTS